MTRTHQLSQRIGAAVGRRRQLQFDLHIDGFRRIERRDARFDLTHFERF